MRPRSEATASCRCGWRSSARSIDTSSRASCRGSTRVRGFTQDDAHLFCTHEQVRGEFRSTMEMTQFFLNSCLGLSDYRVRLSRSDPNDPKYQGRPAISGGGPRTIFARCLIEMNLPYEEAPGEAAFYGPKADFIVRDCIGRQWQLGTVQLDYVLPERFGLEYVGPDNQPHRPVMIHRAPLGSMERFMGILIEHFAGAFPLWLAPEQVRVLPISDKVADYGQRVLAGCSSRASGPASTSAPRRSGPRSATRSSRRSRPCSSSAPRKPRARRSRSATASTAIWVPCRLARRSSGSSPSEPAARAVRLHRLPRLPRSTDTEEDHTY